LEEVVTDQKEGLPPFPVDDLTLDAVEHALGYSLTIDDDGNPVSSGAADYSLHTLLDFMAGCMGRDPNERLIREGRDESDLPEWERGRIWENAEIVEDTRIHYSEHDLIRALIAEIRTLRHAN
jgi:hypothetical protein